MFFSMTEEKSMHLFQPMTRVVVRVVVGLFFTLWPLLLLNAGHLFVFVSEISTHVVFFTAVVEFLQQCVDLDIANCLFNLHILIIRLNKFGVWLIQEMSGFSPVSNISNCSHSEFIPVNSEMFIVLVVISVIPTII